MKENVIHHQVVILGSFKPNKWEVIKESALMLSSLGMVVISPRDTNLVSIPLPDNPDFYYLQKDLDEAGLTKDDFSELNIEERLAKLDCKKLQTRVCRSIIEMGTEGYTYVVLHNNELGKSAANELGLAILYGNKLALSQKIEKVSIEVNEQIRSFIGQVDNQIPIIPQEKLKDSIGNFSKINIEHLPENERRNLIKTSLQILLRRDYTPYERPLHEFTPDAIVH